MSSVPKLSLPLSFHRKESQNHRRYGMLGNRSRVKLRSACSPSLILLLKPSPTCLFYSHLLGVPCCAECYNQTQTKTLRWSVSFHTTELARQNTVWARSALSDVPVENPNRKSDDNEKRQNLFLHYFWKFLPRAEDPLLIFAFFLLAFFTAASLIFADSSKESSWRGEWY